MRFDWWGYWVYARRELEEALIGRDDPLAQEARVRTIVSRSDYAAHHIAKAEVIRQAWPWPVGGAHMRVWKAFKEAAGSEQDAKLRQQYRRIGERLQELQAQREDADYEPDERLSVRDAVAIMKTALSIINTIRGLQGLPPLP